MAKQRGKGIGRALLVTGVTLAGVGAGIGLVLANREKLPANIREFNKRYTNPRMLRSAASERGNLGVIFHQGRKSGREYATPVRLDAVPGGFLVPMPYGTDTDWCKNIQAAEGATVRFRGQDIVVGQPEVIDVATALAMLPPSAGIAARLLRVKQYLRLWHATPPASLTDVQPTAEEHPAQ
ncbi:MAG: nitroreductase [Ktedonobacterales bacterium]|nr:nitroreductase [Ktedonobacterales bacterium]